MACLPLTKPALRSLRRRDAFLPLKRWLEFAWKRRTFPVFVTLKRLAIERLVLIFGMTSPAGDRRKGAGYPPPPHGQGTPSPPAKWVERMRPRFPALPGVPRVER